MNPLQVARRLREQIGQFSGIFSPRFSKPQAKFVEQMLYGIQASQDVKLSSIGRALGEEISLKKITERFSHHLALAGLGQSLNEIVVADAARRVHEETLIIVDPTDIRKSYAQKMPFLATVRDGSTGELVQGYWSCVALACEPESRRVIPLHQRLWSAEAPDFASENAEILGVITTVAQATAGRGIYVVDRGGDRRALFDALLDKGWRFIVRLKGDRNLRVRGGTRLAREVARGCRMRYAERIVRGESGEQKSVRIEYGFRRVQLPGRAEPLGLVVVRGLGEEPLLLLTSVAVRASRRSLWQIVSGYFTRWLVEEVIRFIKQSYRLEELRVLDYERLRNLVALVLAAAYFSAVWLGQSLKLAVLATHVTKVAKRFFGVPDFHYYALADGIAVLLSKLGRWLPDSRARLCDTGQLQPSLF
ncbi:MAG: transposase [Nevskiales bacterium]